MTTKANRQVEALEEGKSVLQQDLNKTREEVRGGRVACLGKTRECAFMGMRTRVANTRRMDQREDCRLVGPGVASRNLGLGGIFLVEEDC